VFFGGFFFFLFLRGKGGVAQNERKGRRGRKKKEKDMEATKQLATKSLIADKRFVFSIS